MYHISRAGKQFIVSLLDGKGQMLSTSPMYKTKAKCFDNILKQITYVFGTSNVFLPYPLIMDEDGVKWFYSTFKKKWKKEGEEEYFEG